MKFAIGFAAIVITLFLLWMPSETKSVPLQKQVITNKVNHYFVSYIPSGASLVNGWIAVTNPVPETIVGKITETLQRTHATNVAIFCISRID